MNKICIICKKEFKPYRKDIVCCSLKCKNIRKKEIHTKSNNNWYKKFKDIILEHNKQYRENHKKEIKIQRHEHYLKNHEEMLQIKKQYYLEHKNEIAKYKKEWAKRNRKRLNKYLQNKRKVDINYKLTHYLRTRLNKVLNGRHKSSSVLKLIGCSLDFLKKHLESQFKSGMTWKNYGKWHIDHIKPCCNFNLFKKSEQHKCFNWRNLQPLWAVENLKKNKYQKDII